MSRLNRKTHKPLPDLKGVPMTVKRLCALLLVLLLLLHPVPAEAGLRAYSEKEGQAWAVFGAYPGEREGTVLPVLWQVLSDDGKQAMLLSEAAGCAASPPGQRLPWV